MGLICHIVTPLDRAISAKMGKLFPAKRVSNLRALYDNVQITQGKEPLKINLDNQEEVNKAVNTLREFWKEENKRRNKTLKYTASNIATAYQAVSKTYTLRERLDRVNMIASMFSAVVDELCANNPGLTRQQIVRGYVDAEGITRFGEAAIFSKVFDQILDNFNDGNYTEEQRREFWKVYENWPALLTYARILLRNTEGVKLGNFETFSGEITDQDFSGNILEEIFDPETTTLESWQESNNMRSAFGSIGVQVRGIISRVPALEVNDDGSVSESRDDLGFRRYMNPTVVHARLQQIFKGMTSSEDMMKRLEKEGKWAEFLKDILKNNPEIRTKFYVDFKKAFQTYEITTESKQRKGFKNQVLKVLNQALNRRKEDTIHRVKKGYIVDEKVSIYDKDGNLNVANLNKILSLARKRFQDNSNDPFNRGYSQAGFWAEKKSFGENRRDVLSILHAYGIQVTIDEITSVMRNKKDLRRLIDLIGKLTTYAINDSIIEQAKQSPLSYYELLADKHGGLYEYIGKITEIIARNNEGLIAENKVIYIDKKNSKKVSLYSFVNPCYMSDTFDRIQSYVEQNDKTGLKQYLTDNYFCSSYFYDPETKTILNMWLKELWDCCLSSKPLSETSAKEFNYRYFLGAQEQVFENFTSKQHNLALITHFMNDRSVSKKATTALYPVFILGDAGCSKFIRAKRYFKEEEMIDAYYNVYRQEIQRMKQAVAMQQKLQEEGYSELASFQKHATSFSCLPFLNEDFVAADGTVGKYAKMIKAEDPIGSVKNAIREYLKEGYNKYKKELEEQGILETKKAKDKEGNEITQYVYFNEAVTPENIDAALKNMYMNIKLATIQQLQFMTIDPAFYKDTKDLQKRYKEIHAPGTLLDIFAIDRNGKRYCNREFERVVYFKDIEIDMEVAAPDFMKVIAELYGKDSDIYNQYKKASLTDGQGFRSLSSYRSVLGMAGKWTPEMETAYNIIMDIRSRYKGQNIPEGELQRLKEVSAVFMPIKPYMYTHEKYALGSDNVLIPVQHKYSEAVLIPELLPEGSKLREMADWMDENDVDMLVADSAVKVGAFGVTDIQNLKGNNLRGALSSGYVHQLRYSDYRIQTNVPEHINGSNLFGTQLRKFVVAAINKGEHYSIGELKKVNIVGEEKELTGQNLMAFYNSIINANIESDLASFLAQIKDPEVVSKALMQAVISDSTVALDRLLAVSTQELANGKKETVSPLFEGGIEHDTSSHLLSWYKKQVNKQRIAGGLLVQASGLGIGKSAQDSSLKYETKTIKDPNTGVERTIITAAQIEMPFNISFEDANGNIKYLDYDDYCNPDGTLKTDQNDVPLIEALLPGCTNIIAYRTPTEGMCSMLNCKVVRFTRPVEGGIIRVPVQGSVTGGWDFDIDKLAFMRRRYIYNEKTGELIKYDPSKEASKNKRVARDNMLIDIIQAMLEDERTQYQRFKPSGFRDASNAAKVMRELQYGDINQLKTMFGRSAAKGSPYEVSTRGDKRFSALVASFSPGTKITLNTGHSEVTIDVSERTIEDIWQNEVKKSKKGQPPASDSILFDETIETSRQLYEQLWAEYFRQNPELESEMLDILKSGRRLEDSFAGRSAVNQADAIISYMKGKYSELANIGLSIIDQLRNTVTSENWQDPEPNYDPSEPSTLVYYNQQNQIAGKLIGIFANENTNVALCSLFDRFELTKAISFAGKSRKDLLNATNKFVPLDAVHQLIAASVDAVKDPVLNYLNFNTLTASSGALLARLGFTFEDIGILFNQPIIKEICEEAFNKEIPLSTAISNVLYKYTDREHPIEEKDLKHINLSSDYLVKNILNFRVQGKDTFKDQTFLNGQLKVLYTFKNIANTASAFTEFTLATKSTASNSVSSNFGDMFAREMSVRKTMASINGEFPVFTYEFSENGETIDSKDPYNPFSYEATAHAANVKAIHTLAEQYFPYNKNFYYKMRDALSFLARSKNISGDIINAAHRDFMAYILSANANSFFNGSYMDEFPGQEGKIATRDYFTKVFPEVIIQFLENPVLKANPFLGKITYEVIGEEGETQQIKLKIDNSEGMAPEIQQAITEAWAELINDTSEEKDVFRFLGEGLFYYCFHTLGFGSGSFSFINLAPTELKLKLCPFAEYKKFSYIQYLKGFLTGKVTASDRQIEEFSFQFVLNHPKLISKFSISSKDKTIKKLIDSYTGDSKQPMPTIAIDTNSIPSRAAESLAWGDDMIGDQEAKVWAPFIQYEHNGRIYIYQIENFKTIDNSPTLTYHLVNFLGEDNVSMQYSSNEPQNVDISEEGTTDIDPEAGPEGSVQQLTINQVIAQISSQMAKKGALNEKPESEPESEVPEQTTTFVTVAPYYDTQFTKENTKELTEAVQQKFLNVATAISKILGINITLIEDNLGGYTNAEGTQIRELSYTIHFDKTEYKRAQLLASLLSDLGHQVQESIILGSYVEPGNTSYTGIEFFIKCDASDRHQIAAILENVGLTDYTINKEGIQVLWFSTKERVKELSDNDKQVNVITQKKYYTREQVEREQDKVFLFGDNLADAKTGYVPRATQAVIRGLPNAIGIPTKRTRGTQNRDYFTDADFEEAKKLIDDAINKALATGKTIVLPQDGIGTGKAQLEARAPKIYKYLQDRLSELQDQEELTKYKTFLQNVSQVAKELSGELSVKCIQSDLLDEKDKEQLYNDTLKSLNNGKQKEQSNDNSPQTSAGTLQNGERNGNSGTRHIRELRELVDEASKNLRAHTEGQKGIDVTNHWQQGNSPDSQDPKFRISTEPIKHNKNEYIKLKNLADYLGHRFGTYMHIHDTLEEIPENIQEAIKNGENIKAWYDGHVVHVYAPHVSSVHDFYMSFIHEVIAHKGMRTFLGKEQYSTLCQKIGNALSEKQKQKIQAYISKSTEEQGDEYIAALAEEMIDDNGNIKEPSTWRKIVSAIRAFFNDMFGLVPTDADIRYMLWRTSEKLRKIEESTHALDQEFINMNSEDYAKHIAEQYNKEGLNTLDQDGNPTKCC